MQRLACDQLLFAPTFIAGFLSLALVFEGRPENIPSKLGSDWLPTMRANLSLWVPSMFINFRFVPSQYQVLFSNCVGFFWNIYLSWVVADAGTPASATK
jgi:protein Mpv17